MGRPSQVVVLVEDERQQRFVRRYLYRLGFSTHDIRFEPVPSGRGSGAQWVLTRYARAVQAYRNRSARAQTALAVAIDADNGSVDRRRQQFHDRAARINGDKIAHLIPKWSIQTWVLCLSGESVDEDQSYRRAPGIDERISGAAETFFDWSRPNAMLPPHRTPSLQDAIPEVRRLD
jgi:hypothetical protein